MPFIIIIPGLTLTRLSPSRRAAVLRLVVVLVVYAGRQKIVGWISLEGA